MVRRLISLLLVLLIGCGKTHPSTVASNSQIAALTPIRDVYRSLSAETVDSDGFIIPLDCDSLLFSSLLAVGRNQPINIEAAQVSPGQWYRNPQHTGCDSSTSRDMLTGLIVYFYHFHRLDLANELYDYGKEHDWNVGIGSDVSNGFKTVMTPGLVALLAEVVYSLGGPLHPEKDLPNIYNTTPGYESHLSLLAISLIGEMRPITESELSVLKTIATLNPMNPLAQALLHKFTDGNQDIATKLILSIYPHDRLPTTADWCEPWRTQRAEGDSGTITPCSPPLTMHTGGDMLYVIHVILGT